MKQNIVDFSAATKTALDGAKKETLYVLKSSGAGSPFLRVAVIREAIAQHQFNHMPFTTDYINGKEFAKETDASLAAWLVSGVLPDLKKRAHRIATSHLTDELSYELAALTRIVYEFDQFLQRHNQLASA